MSVVDLGECHCECHTNPHVMHVVACCKPCFWCQRRVPRWIRTWAMKAIECAKERNE